MSLPSFLNPCSESLPVEMNSDVTCRHTPIDSSSLEDKREPLATAQSKARQLQRMRIKRSINSVNLESLLEERVQLQGIDLTTQPFSDKYGRYGIPLDVVQMFSTELKQPLEETASAMDLVRIQQLRKQHRLAIPIKDLTAACRPPAHLGYM
ncbi:SAM and SH3 domain-containing protein 1-like [Polymixia lowei]